MKDSKLITVLRTFQKNEIKHFEKFLESPYFMEGKNLSSGLLLKCFRWIKTFHPDFERKQFTKENLFLYLYPEKKYKDGSIRYLVSILLRKAEKFLAYSEFNKDNFYSEICLLTSLGARKLDKSFEHHKKLAGDMIEKGEKNSGCFYNEQMLASTVNNFYIYRKQLLKLYNPQKEADSLFDYFIARMLELYRNMAIDESIQNLKYDYIFFKEIIEYIRRKPELFKNNFLLALYYYELMVNLEDKNEHFYELKRIKDKHIHKLDRFGVYDVYVCLNSFCTAKINQGIVAFRAEKFELDKEILKRDLHRDSDYVPVNYFLAATMNSIQIKEYEWTNKFINAYKDSLDPEHATFVFNYVNAQLAFSKGDYGTALGHLGKINIEYSQQKQQMRNLLLMIYYETDAIDSALSLIDSIRHLLTKDMQLTDRQKKSYRNFASFLNELIIIKGKQDKNKLTVFKAKISDSKYFTRKEWLIEKIQELEKRK